jgi:DNA invertase Pin-like site-specific DNA recombinase
MIFGYARVSTHDQNLDLQLSGLRKVGCDRKHEGRSEAITRDHRFTETSI